MLKATKNLLMDMGKGIFDNRIVHHAAAVSFYTIFSVPPVLLISIFIASLVVDMHLASDSLFNFIGQYLNEDLVKVLKESASSARRSESGLVASITGILLLLWASNAIFSALQTAFRDIFTFMEDNLQKRQKIWDVLVSFIMVFVIGFIVLVAILIDLIFHFMIEEQAEALLAAEWMNQMISFLLSYGINAGLFFVLYKLLGAREMKKRNLIIGALVSSFLFSVGKNVLLSYLTQSKWASLYGTAGNLVILLLWMYYNSIVVLFGAQVAESIQQFKQNH
jgi:membrane protein